MTDDTNTNTNTDDTETNTDAENDEQSTTERGGGGSRLSPNGTGAKQFTARRRPPVTMTCALATRVLSRELAESEIGHGLEDVRMWADEPGNGLPRFKFEITCSGYTDAYRVMEAFTEPEGSAAKEFADFFEIDFRYDYGDPAERASVHGAPSAQSLTVTGRCIWQGVHDNYEGRAQQDIERLRARHRAQRAVVDGSADHDTPAHEVTFLHDPWADHPHMDSPADDYPEGVDQTPEAGHHPALRDHNTVVNVMDPTGARGRAETNNYNDYIRD